MKLHALQYALYSFCNAFALKGAVSCAYFDDGEDIDVTLLQAIFAAAKSFCRHAMARECRTSEKPARTPLRSRQCTAVLKYTKRDALNAGSPIKRRCYASLQISIASRAFTTCLFFSALCRSSCAKDAAPPARFTYEDGRRGCYAYRCHFSVVPFLPAPFISIFQCRYWGD